jgi:hypothetical protein
MSELTWRPAGLADVADIAALFRRIELVAAYQSAGITTARLQVESTNADATRLYGRPGFTDGGLGYSILQAPVR